MKYFYRNHFNRFTFGILIKKIWIRILGILLNLFFRLKLTRIPVLPITIDVEPTNKCNYKCPHCQVTHWNKTKLDLDLNSFKKIIGQFPKINFIKLQGMGEPLLCGEFFEMIEYAQSQAINIEFFTNGSICNSKFISAIEKMNRTRIKFSLDGATENTFSKMRPNSNFDKVTNNIRKIIDKRGNNKWPEISFWTVLTSENFDEVEKILYLVKELKADYIVFQMFLNNWVKQDIAEINKVLRVNFNNTAVQNELDKAKGIAKSISVDLRITNDNHLTKKQKCKWPFTSTFIAANGDVVPCCIISDSSVIKMGNIFNDNFSDIWNSKSYQDLRRSIKEHKLYDFCKPCYNE